MDADQLPQVKTDAAHVMESVKAAIEADARERAEVAKV